MSNHLAVKHLGNGRRSYRNITIRRDDSVPQGHRGHWVTAFAINGNIIRTGRLDSMINEIDTALFAAQKARIENEIAAKTLKARKEMYAAAVAAMPPTPWHVESFTEVYGQSFRVYPSPDVVEGSRMAVARGIGQHHVAKLMALAPEMLDLLREVKSGWPCAPSTDLWRKIEAVINHAEAPAPGTLKTVVSA